MGEHEHNSILATGLLCSGIMRNSRGKLFVYVALLGTFFIIMFIFSRTHSNLKELEGVNQKCQQQRDSLSAQLQVVYEHKNRLEKSLQQEKSEHTHTREECDTQHRESEKKQQQDKDKLQVLEKQHTDLKNSYSQLEDDKNILERKMQDQLLSLEKQKEEEILKLQTQLNDMLEEKDKLEKSLGTYKIKLQDHMGELNMCRLQHEQTESKLNAAKEQIKKLQALVPVAESPDVAPEDHKQEIVPKINGDTAAYIHEKLKNGLFNMSNHKEKQVLMRPNIQPPDARRSPSGSSVSKYPNDAPDANANHGGLAKRTDNSPVKAGVDMEANPNKKNSETQNQENKVIPETNDIGDGDENGRLFHQGPLNHPQVQPPHNFNDAGEQGELNLYQQNGMDDQKPQLEQPLNKGHHFSNEIKKNSLIGGFLQPNNGLAVPHLQGLGERHQGDNYVHDNHVQQQPFEVPHNINFVKRDQQHLNDRMVDHADGDDDDDDQDGENEEVQLMGGGPAVRGGKFQDNDFEDQDNGDNENGAKEEEGVVVAPR